MNHDSQVRRLSTGVRQAVVLHAREARAGAAAPEGHAPAPAMREAPGTTPPSANAKVIPFPQPRYHLNDVHFHPTNYAQHGPSCKELLPMMDKLGIYRTVLAPIPTSQIVSEGDPAYRPARGTAICGCSYYINDSEIRSKVHVTKEEYARVVTTSDPLVPETQVDSITARRYNELTAAQKDRFDPMVTGLVLGNVRASEMLLHKLYEHPGVFTGVGEITVHKEFVQDKFPKEYQARLVAEGDKPVRVAALEKLIQTCGDIGMPMVIHNDADVIPAHRDGSAQPRYFGAFVELLRSPKCRNTTIIWAHAAGGGKYSHLRENHVQRLAEVLADPTLEHVHIDLSWDVVAAQLTQTNGKFDREKAQKWVDLIEAYPTRFLFGSDSLAPLSHESWGETAEVYRELLAMLSTETRRQVGMGNYERLIVGARATVRAYEHHCLPIALRAVDTKEDRNETQLEKIQAQCAHDLMYAEVARWLEVAHGLEADPRVQRALQKIGIAVEHASLANGHDVMQAKADSEQVMRKALQDAHQAVRRVAREERAHALAHEAAARTYAQALDEPEGEEVVQDWPLRANM
jgi:hypothetical protein